MGWTSGLATWLVLSCAVGPIVGHVLRNSAPAPVPPRPDNRVRGAGVVS
jgi:hypothetical protein